MKDNQKDKDLAADQRPVPSEAEGPEDTGAPGIGFRPVPSQAEGDEETVEEDLNLKR